MWCRTPDGSRWVQMDQMFPHCSRWVQMVLDGTRYGSRWFQWLQIVPDGCNDIRKLFCHGQRCPGTWPSLARLAFVLILFSGGNSHADGITQRFLMGFPDLLVYPEKRETSKQLKNLNAWTYGTRQRRAKLKSTENFQNVEMSHMKSPHQKQTCTNS